MQIGDDDTKHAPLATPEPSNACASWDGNVGTLHCISTAQKTRFLTLADVSDALLSLLCLDGLHTVRSVTTVPTSGGLTFQLSIWPLQTQKSRCCLQAVKVGTVPFANARRA